MITVKNEIYCNEKIVFPQYNLIEHRRKKHKCSKVLNDFRVIRNN